MIEGHCICPYRLDTEPPASLAPHYQTKQKPPIRRLFHLADGRGFEPPLGFRPKHTFQACAFNHSATHPTIEYPYTLKQKRLQVLFIKILTFKFLQGTIALLKKKKGYIICL